MDELVGELASKAGIDAAVAAKSTGIIPGFLRREGPSDTVHVRFDIIPNAKAAVATTGNGAGRTRPIGDGLMAAGMRRMGLVMSLFTSLGLFASLGLSIGKIQNIVRELFRFGRDQIGADQMGEIIAGTPGLSQFA